MMLFTFRICTVYNYGFEISNKLRYDTNMGRSEFPYYTDLLTVLLRWLTLFGLAISMGSAGVLIRSTGSPNIAAILVLALAAVWNGLAASLSIFNRRLPNHRLLSLAMDILFGAALFVVTGSPVQSIPWVALMPILTAALYYGAAGSIGSAIFMSVFQAVTLFFLGDGPVTVLAISLLVFNLLAGASVALLTTSVLKRLNSIYQAQLSQRAQLARNVQQRERERMKAIFAMVETFSSTLRYQTVLETVVNTAIKALDDPEENGVPNRMIGAVLLFGDRQDLEIHASSGFVAQDETTRLPAEQGALHETLRSGEAILLSQPDTDPELNQLVSMSGRSEALCLPLIRGMNAFGVILFAHQNKEFFTPDRVETLKMLSNQAVIAIQNARLYQDLAREKERLIQSQEDAQKKLARDLHDGPTQSISSIAMRVSILRKTMQRAATTPAAQAALKNILDELERIEELARHTTKEIRHMLFTLRPLVLETEGLAMALTTMADKMRELYQQNVMIEADENVIQMLDIPRQQVVFNLVEEAVSNARKHAHAAEIRVTLKFVMQDRCTAQLEIADNGIGFDVNAVLNAYDRRGSLGLINLRERTEQVNGLLDIDSAPGRGTHIRVFLPLTEEATERLHHRR